MKKVLIPLLFVASTLTANAGSVTFVAPEASMIEEPAMMGGSGAWLVPLIILAVVGLAFATSCNTKKSGNSLREEVLKCR